MKVAGVKIIMLAALTLVMAATLAASLLFAAETAEIKDGKIAAVASPTLGAPVIVKTGDGFRAAVKTVEYGAATKAWLTPANEPAPEISLRVAPGKEADGTAEYMMTPPADTAPGLYDLCVSTSGGTVEIQPHSVKIVSEFKKDFSFVVIADIHFGDSRGQMFAPGTDFDDIRRNVLIAASAVNPEFFLLAGDATNEPSGYRTDYERAWSFFRDYCRAPVFMVPGNHDSYGRKKSDGAFLDGKEYWRAYFGPTYQYFDYGDMRFIGLDDYDWPRLFRGNIKIMSGSESINRGNMGAEQFEWLGRALAGSKGKTVIVFAHLPLDQTRGGEVYGEKRLPGVPKSEVIELLARYGVGHVFIGHWHRNETKYLGNIKQIMTNTSGSVPDSDVLWGFNTVYVRNGAIDRVEYNVVEF